MKKSPLKAKTPLKSKTTLKANNKPKKQKRAETAVLRDKADKLFSKAIRYRDGEKRADGWWCKCITCDTWNPMAKTHAGHFQKRGRLSTRWNEQNVNAQCPSCNTYRDGEQYKYSIALDYKYGDGTAKKLYELAQEDFKLTKDFLECIIQQAEEDIEFYEKGTIW